MRTPLILGAALLAVALPASAQTAQSSDPDSPRAPLPYDRGYDKPDARTDAINARNRAALDAANGRQAAMARTEATVAATEQEQYAADMSAYRQALAARADAVAVDQAISARQERAYADAMTAWRIQVADCRRGIQRACTAPSPRPADFW